MTCLDVENTPAPKRGPWTRQNIPRWFEPPKADDVLLRTEEVSNWLGLSVHTVRWWRNRGKGPAHILIEGKPRYLSGEVRRYIASQQVSAHELQK